MTTFGSQCALAIVAVTKPAERIVELFRSRQPTEILPAESLEEAYAIRRCFQEIEEATSRGAVAGYKIGLTTPVMQDEPRLQGLRQ